MCNKKREKKEVFVYEKEDAYGIALGELTKEQIEEEGLILNKERTEHLREVMSILIDKVKSEFAPGGIKDETTLNFINSTIKTIFWEIAREFDFNEDFYGYYGEFMKTIKYIQDRVNDEKNMIELAEQYYDELMSKHDIEENFY